MELEICFATGPFSLFPSPRLALSIFADNCSLTSKGSNGLHSLVTFNAQEDCRIRANIPPHCSGFQDGLRHQSEKGILLGIDEN